MKTIENAAAFLQSTGLLAEINRVVLHPRGLALSVIVHKEPRNPDSRVAEVLRFGGLVDVRDDPEGYAFIDSDLAEAAARLRAAEADGRCPIAPERQKALGYIVQPVPQP